MEWSEQASSDGLAYGVDFPLKNDYNSEYKSLYQIRPVYASYPSGHSRLTRHLVKFIYISHTLL